MTIYILDNDPAKCAEMLDDESLDKMIKDISQVLCNVHYKPYNDGNSIVLASFGRKVPLVPKNYLKCKWSQWAREIKGNYLYSVELLYELLNEYSYRFEIESMPTSKDRFYRNYFDITRWARNNVPDLPVSILHPFPLVMPKKYHKILYAMINPPKPLGIEVIQSYRNYYNQRLKKKLEKCNSICTTDNEIMGGHGDTRKVAKWTNRKKPEWINL